MPKQANTRCSSNYPSTDTKEGSIALLRGSEIFFLLFAPKNSSHCGDRQNSKQKNQHDYTGKATKSN